jgi:hypothetical protein
MKRLLTVALLIALAAAGALLMAGCPSEADTGKTVEGNILLKDGQYQHNFATPAFQHGKTYEVILTVEECDEALWGGYWGGKICYKVGGGEEKILSGWARPVPSGISETVHEYKWTFTAGAANDDDKPIENPATLPSGATQYFALTAQDNEWHNFPAGRNFNVKGEINVIEKEELSYVSDGVLTLGTMDGLAGKGQWSNANSQRVLALPNNAKITFTISVTVNSDDAKPGNGVGAMGSNWSGPIDFTIPGDAPMGPYTFTKDVEISALKVVLGTSTTIIINLYNGASITRAEIWIPAP